MNSREILALYGAEKAAPLSLWATWDLLSLQEAIQDELTWRSEAHRCYGEPDDYVEGV